MVDSQAIAAEATDADLRAIARQIINSALSGDFEATKLLFDMIDRGAQLELADAVDRLEQRVEALEKLHERSA